MMNHLGINMNVVCKKDDILAKLRTNREQHSKMVAEARVGYVKEAKKALETKLDALASGKIIQLRFDLSVPQDFTTVYDTTIGMLEMHTGETIELSADEFRHLVEDEWEWTKQFIGSNMRYSGSTQAYAASKGYGPE